MAKAKSNGNYSQLWSRITKYKIGKGPWMGMSHALSFAEPQFPNLKGEKNASWSVLKLKATRAVTCPPLSTATLFNFRELSFQHFSQTLEMYFIDNL